MNNNKTDLNNNKTKYMLDKDKIFMVFRVKGSNLQRIFSALSMTILMFVIGTVNVFAYTETPSRNDVVAGNDYVGTSITVSGSCIAGQGNPYMEGVSGAFKMRTNLSLTSYTAASSPSNGFYVTVNSGYVVNSITIKARSNYEEEEILKGVYVDGSADNFISGTTYTIPDKTSSTCAEITLSGLNAIGSIAFECTNGKQLNMDMIVTYSTLVPQISLPETVNAMIGKGMTVSAAVETYLPTTYQWYECDDADKTNAVAIDGETSTAYSMTPTEIATKYFYCVATNSAGSTTSNVCTVNVTEFTHTFDFTNWSSATLANCDADADKWCIYEKYVSGTTEHATDNANNDKGKYLHATWSRGVLTANGINVSETYPLQFQTGGAHQIGLMFDLASSTLGTYNGSKYLWLMKNDISTVYVPNVVAGSTMSLGVESHKIEQARGVMVYYGSIENDTWTSLGTYTATNLEKLSFEIPGTTGYTDVKLVCVIGGSHLYYIDCDYNDFTLLTPAVSFNNVNESYSFTKGNDYTTASGASVSFESSDASIATVDASGVIVAKGNGSTTVTITQAAHDGLPEISKTITVNVSLPRTISYSKGTTDAAGILPDDESFTTGETIKLPYSPNQLLYKAGCTLTGWNDGTTTYAVGADYTVTNDVVFTPVFTPNTESLSNLNANTTVTWQFGRSNGAPTVAWQTSATNYIVTQATINGEVQDLPLAIAYGKFNNASRTDALAQVNNDTEFTIPAVSGMQITLTNGWSDASAATITDGSMSASFARSGSSGNFTLTYTYTGAANEVKVTIGGGGYYSAMTVVYPRIPKPLFTTDLAGQYLYKSGTTSLKLNVEAKDADAYQWYSNTSASTVGATPVSGATGTSYTVSNPTEGIYYFVVATNSYGSETSTITTLRESVHTFDFTCWSDQTKNNLLAGAFANASTVNPANNWSDVELASGTEPSETSANNCFWQVNVEEGTLHANGAEIAELRGLVFSSTYNQRALAIAVDYPVALSTYYGPSYLWLGRTSGYYFTIPSVKVGSTIRMGVESHKTTEARGVTLTNVASNPDVPKTYTEQEWTVTGNGDYVDVNVTCTNGCHIYWIDVDMAGFNLVNNNIVVKPGNTYKLADGLDYNNISGMPLTFTSSNPAIATVSDDGTISMLASGMVTITVSQEANGVYSASSQTFTVAPSNAVLSAAIEPKTLKITSPAVKTQTVSVHLSGSDFDYGSACSVSVNGANSNISVAPNTFQVERDGSVYQEFVVTYNATSVQTDRTLTLSFTADDRTLDVEIPYGRTIAYAGTEPTPVSEYHCWDWSTATDDVSPDNKEGYMSFRDVNGATWTEGFDYEYLAGSGQFFARKDEGSKCFQGGMLYFNNTVSGSIEIEFSNTGSSTRPFRYLNINGVNTPYKSDGIAHVVTAKIPVEAGGVMIQGRYNDEDGTAATDSIDYGPQYLRIFKLTFRPDAQTPVITLNNENSSFTLATDDPTDVLYYTTDGTEPNVLDAIKYIPNLDDNNVDQGIHLASNCTIKAIAASDMKNTSPVAKVTTKFATYKLNITISPDLCGYVEYSPASKNYTYTIGTNVSVTAFAKPGYGFKGWADTKFGELTSTEPTKQIVINADNNAYYALFDKGPQGTVIYDVFHGVYIDKDATNSLEEIGAYPYQYDETDELPKGYDKFPSSSTSTSIVIPSNYTLLYEDNEAKTIATLVYWVDKDLYAQGIEKRYNLGENRFFEEEGQTITLIPVFRMDAVKGLFETRTASTTVTWDFRTGYGAQTMAFSGESERYYTTHVSVDGSYYDSDSQSTIDVKDYIVDEPIIFNTTQGSFTNKVLDTWATMTQGTKITLPSGYGAKITLATYAPINKVGGTTINGKAPDNVNDEYMERTAERAYLYTWTIDEDETTAELVIGNDYSYYQYLTAVLPNAQYKYINYSSNNVGMGTVSATPEGISTERGYAYTNGTVVTLTANRSRYYELKYWLDGEGNKLYPDGHYEDADGINQGTFIGRRINDITYNTVTDETISFSLSAYLELQGVFGDKNSYYINFSAGGQAAGLPPYQQHVEWDEPFSMPVHNQHLYLEGYTLDYYTDESGNRYDFNTEYNTENNRIDGDLLLTPHFKENSVSLGNVSDNATIEWPLSVSRGATEINYNRSAGLIVDQLTIGSETIDLPCYINGDGGSVNNTTNESSCTINSGAVFTLPTTANCVIELHSTSGNISKTQIAGTTNYSSKSSDNLTVTVNYSGAAATQTINFKGDSKVFSYVKVTYGAVSSTPDLTAVTIDDVAISAAQLSTLLSNNVLSDVSASVNYTSDAMPVVKATANNGGTANVTQATPENPVATILVKTSGGITVGTYTINFTVMGKTAPAVSAVTVSGVNANGVLADGVGVSGIIAVTLDHSVAATNLVVEGNSAAEMNQTLHGVADGNTLKLAYWDLKAGTDYTLTIPAGTLKDIYGMSYGSDITVNFRTAEGLSVTPKVFNFVVTHSQVWDTKNQQAGERVQLVEDRVLENLAAMEVKYGTLDEGIALANAAGGNDRYYIFVPDGEYQLKGNTTRTGDFRDNKDNSYSYTGGKQKDANIASVTNFYNGETWIKRNQLSLVGQSADSTIIFNDPYIYGISYTSTLEVRTKVQDCYFQDFTVDNRYSKFQVDAGISNPGDQAVAVYDRGIRSIWKNVTMKGYQDTYAASSNSSGSATTPGYFHTYRYYEDCSVWGTVDFICGGGDDWWERPTLVLRDRVTYNNIVAPRHANTNLSSSWLGDDYMFCEKWGYVFNNATVKAESTSAYNRQNGGFTLGRPWQLSPACTFLNTKFEITPVESGWSNMAGTLVIRLHEYGSMNADGTVMDLTKRTLRASTPAAGSDDCVLTAEDAAQYTKHNVLGGEDAYDPTIYTKQIDMDKTPLTLGDEGIRWGGMTGALCYFIFRQDKTTGKFEFYSMSSTNSFKPDDADDGRVFYVRAANVRGGLGKPSKTVVYKKLGEYVVTVKQVGPDPDKGWSTVCLPENAVVPGIQDANDIIVYAAKTIEGTAMQMVRVDKLVANRGYVIYATPGTYTFYATREVIENVSDYASVLDGNPEDHAVSTGLVNCYALAYKPTINAEMPGFYKFTGSTIPAYKAYLAVETLAKWGISMDTAGAAKGLSFSFVGWGEEDEEEANAIEGVIDDEENSEIIYDLTGKRILRSQMRKGMIYIVNGEKILF